MKQQDTENGDGAKSIDFRPVRNHGVLLITAARCFSEDCTGTGWFDARPVVPLSFRGARAFARANPESRRGGSVSGFRVRAKMRAPE